MIQGASKIKKYIQGKQLKKSIQGKQLKTLLHDGKQQG
tara:strand:+ start:1054 stop:1167 length:114 start_codon:yes stop_codon:yes gene_type:complete